MGKKKLLETAFQELFSVRVWCPQLRTVWLITLSA